MKPATQPKKNSSEVSNQENGRKLELRVERLVIRVFLHGSTKNKSEYNNYRLTGVIC